MRSNLVRMAALCLLMLLGGGGLAWGSDQGQGLFLRSKDGDSVPAPVLGATVEVKVTGIIARTRVTQIFTNPSRDWLEGIYIFPLPADGAVDTLRMKVGERTLQGVIQEKEVARQAYQTACGQGVKASLIEQQRPGVFTTSVANIGPGETVEIAIELQQVVQWDHDRFRLRFPMVVTPRENAAADSGLPSPPVRRRGAPPINPFAFHADLDPGFPLAKVESPSHAITVAKGKDFRYAVDLKEGVAPADSDLVLEWAPAVGREPRAVFYSEEVDGERYDLLMVMPPDAPEAAAARAQLDAPMLQRIEVQWGDPSAEAWPARIPDLYLGEPLVLTARSSDGGGPVSVSGSRGGSAWSDSFPTAAKVKGAGIDKLWARRKIQALMDSLHEGADAGTVRQAVVDLGLRHHLITDYTSLVAVDDQRTAPAGAQPVTRIVPVNPPRQERVLDEITVTAESPLLDERRISTGATVTLTEVDKIPTVRDPWAVLQTTPGIVTDRINVGGNEGGDQVVWSSDGMVITDTAAQGAAPVYYDFDIFGEIPFTIPEAEAKALCAEIQRAGWNGITLDRVLAAAPSLKGALQKAADAGLLRGFLALALHDKGCSQPPEDVIAEAWTYWNRFGLPKG